MITFQNVSFSYPNSIKPAINNISFTIHRGELVLITGVSGSGKSTLLKCINGLVPHFSGGSISGKITIDGHDPVKESPKSLCQVVGFVFQDPECQFVMDRVEDEIAFVLENFDFPPQEIEERINKALSSFDLNDLRYRNISNLSGGEQQKVAIASVLALQPSILVLDEPTSQLDPESADNLLQILKDLNEHENLTIILSEHRLERVVPYTNRIIHLDAQGNLEAAGHPRQVLQNIDIEIPLIEAAKILEWKSMPLSVDEAKYIAQHEGSVPDIHIKNKKRNSNVILFPQVVFHMSDPVSYDNPLIQINNLSFSYNGISALSGVSLNLYQGEIAVLMGVNGAGKSTLARCIVGLLRPQYGNILFAGKDLSDLTVAEICRDIAFLPQDPNMMLFADKVEDELWITLRNHRIEIPPISPLKLLKQLGLSDKANQYPRDLSTGERQRVALGAILVTKPSAILLDEPTRGLDYAAKRKLVELLKTWQVEGKAILLITHDVEFAAQIADTVIILDQGKIIQQGKAKEIFSQFSPYITQIAQVFPGHGWITIKDIGAESPNLRTEITKTCFS